jgi:hypothetical protein
VARPDPAALGRRPKYRFFRGHFGGAGLATLLPEPPVTITFLRRTIPFVLSTYRFIRREPNTRFHALAASMSFADFVADPRPRRNLSNVQVRNLSFTLAQDPRPELAKVEQKTPWDVATRLEQLAAWLPPEEKLERATGRLRAMPCFGLTDRFDESMALLAYTFGWPHAGPVQKLMVAPPGSARPEVPDEIVEQIRAFNTLDGRLLAEAEPLFEARVAAMLRELGALARPGERPPVRYADDPALVATLLDRHYERAQAARAAPRVERIRVDFARRLDGSGWQGRERTGFDDSLFRWTGPDTVSTLDLPLVAGTDHRIELRTLNALAPDILDSLRLEAGGRPVELAVEGRGVVRTWRGLIPKQAIDRTRPFTRLTLRVNRTLSKASLDPNDPDTRQVGICVHWIALEATGTPAPAEPPVEVDEDAAEEAPAAEPAGRAPVPDMFERVRRWRTLAWAERVDRSVAHLRRCVVPWDELLRHPLSPEDRSPRAILFSHVKKSGGTTLQQVIARNYNANQLIHINAPDLYAHPRPPSRCVRAPTTPCPAPSCSWGTTSTATSSTASSRRPSSTSRCSAIPSSACSPTTGPSWPSPRIRSTGTCGACDSPISSRPIRRWSAATRRRTGWPARCSGGGWLRAWMEPRPSRPRSGTCSRPCPSSGVTEEFDGFLLMAQRLLGWTDLSYVRQNVTPRAESVEIREEDLELVRRLNPLDLELHAFARRVFRERAAAVGITAERLAAHARAQVAFAGLLAPARPGAPPPTRAAPAVAAEPAVRAARPARPDAPLFITGRFRSGSTLLWQIFDRNERHVAFYEPCHDNLLQQIGYGLPSPSHRGVESYWGAYLPILETVRALHRPEFGFDRLLLEAGESHTPLRDYLAALIAAAGGRRPVLQFNRCDFRPALAARRVPRRGARARRALGPRLVGLERAAPAARPGRRPGSPRHVRPHAVVGRTRRDLPLPARRAQLLRAPLPAVAAQRAHGRAPRGRLDRLRRRAAGRARAGHRGVGARRAARARGADGRACARAARAGRHLVGLPSARVLRGDRGALRAHARRARAHRALRSRATRRDPRGARAPVGRARSAAARSHASRSGGLLGAARRVHAAAPRAAQLERGARAGRHRGTRALRTSRGGACCGVRESSAMQSPRKARDSKSIRMTQVERRETSCVPSRARVKASSRCRTGNDNRRRKSLPGDGLLQALARRIAALPSLDRRARRSL